ncbi:MAG: arginine repressor [Clostridiales bacterium]|nr:arginine repressor [Clostridiales bacterium]
MKTTRQEKILEIIAQNDIETQNQLIEALKAHGFASTQATVSRDLRELRLVKELTSAGRYKYTTPSESNIVGYSDRLRTIFRESVTSFARAQNIVVLKTLPGLASAACSALDGMSIRDLVGTLGGDDTAFLAMTDNNAAEIFCAQIKSMLS